MFRDGWFAFGMHAFWWIFWVIVIAGVALALARGSDGRSRERETPLETLRRRYARGEVSTQEYEERRAILERDTDGKST
jgi:putative membrane protein